MSRPSPEEAIASLTKEFPSPKAFLDLFDRISNTTGVSRSFAKILVERSWSYDKNHLLRQVIAVWLEIATRERARDPKDTSALVKHWEQPFDWADDVSSAYPETDLDTAALLAVKWEGSFDELMACAEVLGPARQAGTPDEWLLTYSTGGDILP